MPGYKADLMGEFIDLFHIHAPGKDLEIVRVLQQTGKIDVALVEGQFVPLFQRHSVPAPCLCFKARAVAVQPFLHAKPPMDTQVTSPAPDQSGKMQDGILPYHYRLPARDELI